MSWTLRTFQVSSWQLFYPRVQRPSMHVGRQQHCGQSPLLLHKNKHGDKQSHGWSRVPTPGSARTLWEVARSLNSSSSKHSVSPALAPGIMGGGSSVSYTSIMPTRGQDPVNVAVFLAHALRTSLSGKERHLSINTMMQSAPVSNIQGLLPFTKLS